MVSIKELGFTYISSLEFAKEEILERIKRRGARKLREHKYAIMNRWHLALYEEDLRSNQEIPFVVRGVHPLIGNGVFTESYIPQGAFVGEYTGVVRRRRIFRGERDNDYVFGYVVGSQDTPYVIDAKEKGNFTRFINHSFAPNLLSKSLICDGIGRIIFVAKRPIEKGEQLTYDYGPHYWRKRPYPQPL